MKSIQLLVDARGRARRSGFYDETSWADWCNFNAMSGDWRGRRQLKKPTTVDEARATEAARGTGALLEPVRRCRCGAARWTAGPLGTEILGLTDAVLPTARAADLFPAACGGAVVENCPSRFQAHRWCACSCVWKEDGVLLTKSPKAQRLAARWRGVWPTTSESLLPTGNACAQGYDAPDLSR